MATRHVTQHLTTIVPARTPDTAPLAAAGVKSVPEVATGQRKLTFPELPAGFAVRIATTSAPDVIAEDGTITRRRTIKR